VVALLVAVAVAVDALLLLMPAGTVPGAAEVVGLAIAAITTFAVSRWSLRPELLAAPLVGFVLFRLALGWLIDVPQDAVIRDAQAGLAVMVVVGAQFAVIGFGMSGRPQSRR